MAQNKIVIPKNKNFKPAIPPKKPSTLNKHERRLIGGFFTFAFSGLLVIFTLWLAVVLTNYFKMIEKIHNRVNSGSQPISLTGLPTFASCEALKSKLGESGVNNYRMLEKSSIVGWGTAAPQAMMNDSAGAPTDYSQTNIQVAGVDEADIVKTDGHYIYTLSNNELTISLAYPPDQAKLLSKTKISGQPTEILIEGNNLMVFGHRQFQTLKVPMKPVGGSAASGITQEMDYYSYYSYYDEATFVEIYELSDPSNPVLKRKIEFEGSYLTSRKIENYVYFVLNSYPHYYGWDKLKEGGDYMNTDENEGIVPRYKESGGSKSLDAIKSPKNIVSCQEVRYIEPIESGQYLTVIGLPINDFEAPIAKEVILGSSQNVYASLENLYVANTEYIYDETAPMLKKIMIRPGQEITRIFKFSLAPDNIQFLVTGEVPGRILNQFSMDEHKGNFRIATTLGNVSRSGGGSANNVYVLDSDLKIIGSIEDIAPGEQIHSARFMGDKAYLVTFKKVDPFFTLDLSIPTAPKILGKLKIPGYSDYLHPYDENHIIGIGKETVEAEEGDFAWYQGLKMALFDVSDFTNPREVGKVEIGDRGTDSPILTDHKALLFSKEKNLLVIPVTVAEISDDQKNDPNYTDFTYAEFAYQGSYVFTIDLDKGFILKGRITHQPDDPVYKETGLYKGKVGWYDAIPEFEIYRNLYINNSLYSISAGKILINSLNDLAKQGEINLGEIVVTPEPAGDPIIY